jgi:hypothetical protein
MMENGEMSSYLKSIERRKEKKKEKRKKEERKGISRL